MILLLLLSSVSAITAITDPVAWEARENLTLRVTVLTDNPGGTPLYLGGSGAWLDDDPAHLIPLAPLAEDENVLYYDISYR